MDRNRKDNYLKRYIGTYITTYLYPSRLHYYQVLRRRAKNKNYSSTVNTYVRTYLQGKDYACHIIIGVVVKLNI